MAVGALWNDQKSRLGMGSLCRKMMIFEKLTVRFLLEIQIGEKVLDGLAVA
jgi:hypothetical protein